MMRLEMRRKMWPILATSVLLVGFYFSCWAGTISPKATIILKVSENEINDVRRHLHEIAIQNNFGFIDHSHRFPSGTSTINARLQRADQLEAGLLGILKDGKLQGDLDIAIYCESPCERWMPFFETLVADMSAHWPTEPKIRD